MKKNKDDLDSIYNMLDGESKDIYDTFLSYHPGEKSCKQYRSAILNMIYEVIKKYNFKSYAIEDFEKVLEYYKTDLSNRKPTDSFRESFFKYLFALDIMKYDSGFTTYFTKEQCRNQFEKKISNEKNKEKECLTFMEIIALEEFLEDNPTIEENLKMSFMAHMLYNEDIDVSDLKEISINNYNFKEKVIHIKNKNYPVLEKHIPLFEEIIVNKQVYQGFTVINQYMDKLGQALNIESLTPRKIKNTRKANNLICPICKKSYSNRVNNWTNVNNKIICSSCYEELKKNNKNLIASNFKNNEIKIDITNNTKDINSLYSFETLQKKLLENMSNNDVDFEKINKLKKQIGDLGEAFVYEYEKNKLKNTQYYELVDNTPAKNPSLGYDILSYDLDGRDIYIEVKTEISNKNNDFYISNNELAVAKEKMDEGKKYLIYRVHNIFKAKKDIFYDILSISDIINDSKYCMKPHSWKIVKK